jgi:putative ABC transport system permease protein
VASLAIRNLLHDRVRLAVTLVGIVFSVVLSAIQLGLFMGFRTATADVITNSQADVWVMSRGVTHLESAVPFPERRLYQLMQVPGVERAERYLVNFSQWERPDGAEEGIMVIGLEPTATMGLPWNLTAGRVEDLLQRDAVIVDELYLAKLGVSGVGDTAEIRDRRVKIVGTTRGIRTFTTAPPVFASLNNAHRFVSAPDDRLLYTLVRTRPDADPATVAAAITDNVPGVDARTREQWRAAQEYYWMFGTGAGITVLIAAALGLLVGVVIVAQTIYAATVDHIREYGTLKAMGATNGYIYRVITQQALLSGVAGYVIGITIALTISRASLEGTTAILIPWPMAAALAVITAGMCLVASIVSINKATRIDPAMVFRN